MLINQDFKKLSSEFNDPSKPFKYVVKRLHQPYLVEMPVNGVTTLELAKKIEQSIFDNYCGIYHLCSKEKLSEYKLLTFIQKQWGDKKFTLKKYKVNRYFEV